MVVIVEAAWQGRRVSPRKQTEKPDSKEQELMMLRKVAEYMSSNLELAELLNRIVTMATDVTRADSCFIYLFDKQHNELVLRASSNPRTRVVGDIRLKLGEGVTGWAAKEKRPVALEREAYKDPRFRARLRADYEFILACRRGGHPVRTGAVA